MARIRTIKPEFWESETVGTLSFGARLLFLASLNIADDEGLLRWNSAYLSSSAFIYDDVKESEITQWMTELENGGFVFPYQAGKTNQRLAWIINFKNHQVINRPQPSKLPGPSIQSTKYRDAIYERDKNICHICNEEVDRTAQPNIRGSKAPSIDHIVPQSKGGSDYPSNLKTAHISCNKSRGNQPLNDSVNDSRNYSVNDSRTEGKGRERNKEPKTFSSSEDEVEGNFYLSKKGKKLTGQRLESFERFWTAFGYKASKAEAADAWLAIPILTEAIVAKIIKAAQAECARRPDTIAQGKTPKMAQGWLSGRRWEDEALSGSAQMPSVMRSAI